MAVGVVNGNLVSSWRTAILVLLTVLPILLPGCRRHSPRQLADRAMVKLERGDYSAAIAGFSRALKLDTGNVMLYLHRGKAYGRRGYERETGEDFGRAIADFTQYLFRRPLSAEGFYLRGSAYNAVGRYTEALRDLRRATEIQPGYVDVYRLRGTMWAGMGVYDSAVVDLDKAIALDSGDANSYLMRALACEEAGRVRDAVDSYRLFVARAERLPEMAEQVDGARQKIAELADLDPFTLRLDVSGRADRKRDSVE